MKRQGWHELRQDWHVDTILRAIEFAGTDNYYLVREVLEDWDRRICKRVRKGKGAKS